MNTESEVVLDSAGEAKMWEMLVNGASHTAIFQLDRHGRIERWNAGAERIKGWKAAEVIGKHFSIFYTDEDRAAGVPEQALAIARTQGKFEAEGWRVRADGSRFFADVIIEPIYDGGVEVGFAKVVRDATQRYLANKQLSDAESMLRQAQKMEAAAKLAGGIAHDLNNLFAVITGSAELILRKVSNYDIARYSRRIIETTGRGAYLVKQLVLFARRQPLHPRKINTSATLAYIGDIVRTTIRRDIAVVFEVEPGIPCIEVDPDDLQMAMLNLCMNAQDAIPNGGGEIRVEAASGGKGMVEIRVCDNGSGIPEAIVSRVTEPFFTTKEPGKGSGLGLSQAYAFCEQSGGWLSVTSLEGRGTVIHMNFPAAICDAEAAEPSESSEKIADATSSSGPCILVVDDDEETGGTAAELLRDCGYTPVRVNSGAAALNLLDGGRHVDLVFSDVVMPGMSGTELVREIRSRGFQVPIILCSGYARDDVPKADGEVMLAKPYRLPDLISAVEAAIKGSGPVSAA